MKLQQSNKYIEILLDRIGAQFEPEIVPVRVEPMATLLGCYYNVEEKVRRDGGKIHYGWAIWQTSMLCEAEHHAVWEDEHGNLIDITPRSQNFDIIVFVSDNSKIFDGVSFDNIRINTTNNPLVDDYILVCETITKLYSFGKREGRDRFALPQIASKYVKDYEDWKLVLEQFINAGNKLGSKCFCSSMRSYSACHGKALKTMINNDINDVIYQLNNIL